VSTRPEPIASMSFLFDTRAWATLDTWQFVAIGLLFVWSGFVRSGLGFGGAALTLPMLLLVLDEPIVFLPAIAMQLLVFSTLTVATRIDNVDWGYLARISSWLALPFAAGLFGLLQLPGSVLSLFVYALTFGYGLLYLLDRSVASGSRVSDVLLLGLGGYASGVSLTGAPLIAAVGARQLPAHRVRDTLFVLWIVLVLVKLFTFQVARVPFQWALFFSTLPLVSLGHVLGLRVHERLVRGEARGFRRMVGAGLMLVAGFGLVVAVPRVLG